MKNGHTHRFGKTAGGIKSILLTEICNLQHLTLDPETGAYTAVSFAHPHRIVTCSFGENAAVYRQELQSRDGIVSVEHLLEFNTDKIDLESDRLLRELVQASYCGLAAIVTTQNNLRLVVGYSEENRGERPLRLYRSSGSSGKKHTDPAHEAVSLKSCDTAKARLFTGSIG